MMRFGKSNINHHSVENATVNPGCQISAFTPGQDSNESSAYALVLVLVLLFIFMSIRNKDATGARDRARGSVPAEIHGLFPNTELQR